MVTNITGLSPSAVDQLFVHWAGVDLTHFLHPLRLHQTREKILETANLLAASRLPDEGLTGRSHACAIRCSLISLSCRQHLRQGAGLTIRYGLSPSPFGDCLLAVSGEEISHLSFVDKGQEQLHIEELRRNWPRAVLIAEDTLKGQERIRQIFAPAGADCHEPLRLLLQGTSFQLRVWQALLALPRGSMISYQGLADHLGHPAASRAVANAVAANPISYLIPCHRVISKSGNIHCYRWGGSRKKAMLGWEASLPDTCANNDIRKVVPDG